MFESFGRVSSKEKGLELEALWRDSNEVISDIMKEEGRDFSVHLMRLYEEDGRWAWYVLYGDGEERTIPAL